MLALGLAASLAVGLAAAPAAAQQGLPVEARLDHIGVVVADIDRSIRFYTDYFGFRVVRRGDYTLAGAPADPRDADLTAAFVKAPGASSAIELIQFRKPLPGLAPGRPGGFHLGLYIKDVRAAYARLSAAGLKFSGPPRPRAGGWTASLQDPDGTALELLETAADPAP